MSLSSLQVLADNRDALLLAEVGAWLHMLGKFHENFLNDNHDLATCIPADLTIHYTELDQLLRGEWTGSIWAKLPVKEFGASELSICHLIEEHQNRNVQQGFLRLMQDAHGRGSSIEKGVLDRFAPSQTGTVYPATAVGREVEAVDLKQLSDRRKALYTFLKQQLERCQKAGVSWSKFRRPFIHRMERDFRTTVADTRRPLNDVTLFDQTVASVAFFKAALAQNLLTGWQEPNKKDVNAKYHWRILRVGLDGMAYWGQSARVNDLLSRKALVDPALDHVRDLLEETYPLGMEIYRDENGSLFIVADVDNLLGCEADGVLLEERLQKIADQSFNGEARFGLKLSERTRNTLSFGNLATAALPPPVPFPPTVTAWWNGAEGRDVCPVCGLRPQGPAKKALERKVCDVCKCRRVGRSQEWAGELHTTMWVDETADVNGRAALVVGRLGLEPWLCGKAFNTVMAFDPSERQLTYKKRNNKAYTFSFKYADLVENIQKAFSFKQVFGKSSTLLDNLLLSNARGNFKSFTQIYNLYVQDTDLNSDTQEAWRFALAIMRQQPAFARLRRIWETARGFWDGMFKELGDKGILPTVAVRLVICAGNLAQLDLGFYNAYELELGPTTLAVVHREGDLITVDNLQRVARLLGAGTEVISDSERAARFVQNHLEKRKTCVIGQPSEYGRPNKLHLPLQITQVSLDFTGYQPVIPILTEPRTFMSLVPAKQALEITSHIQQRYVQCFGKVQNRLPLFLGLVFFPRKLPLAAVIDTARRMLDEVSLKPVTAEVQKTTADAGDWPAKVQVQLSVRHDEVTIGTTTVMGDGSTHDLWYPYWLVKGKPTDRQLCFAGPGGEHWVHVKDLREGDAVQFTPSRFAYLFLEHTGRRFGFDADKETLLLDDLPRLQEMWDGLKGSGITDTALRNVYALLDSKRAAWGGGSKEFKDLVQTTLRHANLSGAVKDEDVVSGRLGRCLELYLHILKQRVKGEKDGKQSETASA